MWFNMMINMYLQAYIFDIRSGTYLHKLTGHTDTVGDVAYHPLYPQVILPGLKQIKTCRILSITLLMNFVPPPPPPEGGRIYNPLEWDKRVCSSICTPTHVVNNDLLPIPDYLWFLRPPVKFVCCNISMYKSPLDIFFCMLCIVCSF